MKRLSAGMLVCALALTAFACAAAEDERYTLEEDGMRMTVRLSGDTRGELDWKCEISAPEIVEQTGGERIPGEGEDAPFTRVFRFAARAGESGAVSLIFRYADEEERETVRTLVLETVVDESGAFALKSVYEQQPYADWCAADGDTVTVFLPVGCEWSYEVIDPQALIPAQERMEADGGIAVSFRRAEDAPESIELAVTSAESEDCALCTRTITLRTEKDGSLLVERVSELRIFE